MKEMKRELCVIENNRKEKGIELCFGGGRYCSPYPVEIQIRETGGGMSYCRAGYEAVEETEKGYYGKALIRTKYGSEIRVLDYYTWQAEELVFVRKAKVIKADGHEEGFSSSIAFRETQEHGLQDYAVFIPGIWYRRNENVVQHAFGSSPSDRYYLIRTTRMALPYVELYRQQAGEYIAMKHLSPAPSTGRMENSADWLVDASLQYASMGIRNEGAAELVYQFPGSEGEKNYIDARTPWARRSHPLQEGFRQEYSLALTAGAAKDDYEAMRRVWRFYYEKEKPVHTKADVEKVYRDSVELLNVYCQEYNKAVGLPFWATVPEGTVCDISFQMGFVGQQTMCAYHLLRYGYEQGQWDMVAKAGRIINFWVQESARDSVIPRVWYNAFPDTFRKDYPTYTRTAADGMEGILACFLYAKREGRTEQEWLDFCIRYADWLAENQNADGSWYRAYDETGSPVQKGIFNTTNVIRFLVNLYWETKREIYRMAALRAGDFCYEKIFLPMQYVGGTADNDNTLDKEAGMIAVYAFMALYDMDGEERWLEAAQGAADFTETWTYAWDYQVKPYKGNAVFDRAGITGLSLIATGHSHADVMMGYMPYEYYRLYLHTGDTHYREFSLFLNGNTKQTMDWSGRLGHAYPGLVEESGELALQYHNGLGRWLPWCTIAQIESLTRFRERFGKMDVEEIEGMDAGEREEKNRAAGFSWLCG